MHYRAINSSDGAMMAGMKEIYLINIAAKYTSSFQSVSHSFRVAVGLLVI